MPCPNCHTGTVREGLAETCISRGGRLAVFYKVPAKICDQCGDTSFSQEVATEISRLFEEGEQPTDYKTAWVYDLELLRQWKLLGQRPTAEASSAPPEELVRTELIPALEPVLASTQNVSPP